MRTFIVESSGQGCRVTDRERELLAPTSETAAVKFALHEASRSFDDGERAQVFFRCIDDLRARPLVLFTDDD